MEVECACLTHVVGNLKLEPLGLQMRGAGNAYEFVLLILFYI